MQNTSTCWVAQIYPNCSINTHLIQINQLASMGSHVCVVCIHSIINCQRKQQAAGSIGFQEERLFWTLTHICLPDHEFRVMQRWRQAAIQSLKPVTMAASQTNSQFRTQCMNSTHSKAACLGLPHDCNISQTTRLEFKAWSSSVTLAASQPIYTRLFPIIQHMNPSS